jgi:hypothetical protein
MPASDFGLISAVTHASSDRFGAREQPTMRVLASPSLRIRCSGGRCVICKLGRKQAAGVIADHPKPRGTSTQVANDSTFSGRFSPRHDGEEGDPKLLFIKIKYGAHIGNWGWGAPSGVSQNNDESAGVIRTSPGKFLQNWRSRSAGRVGESAPFGWFLCHQRNKRRRWQC